MGKNAFDWIALLLVIIAAINWGIVGISNFAKHPFDLITSWAPSWLSNSIFALVGIAGLYTIYFAFVSKK